MKKLITGILATLLAVGCFTACNFGTNNSSENSTQTSIPNSESTNTGAESVVAAAEYIKGLYLEKNVETREDYFVAKQLVLEDVTYDITWTVDVTAGVTVVVEETNVKIDVDENLAEDLAYVLTATLSDGTNTAEVTFNRTVKAAPQMVPAPISEKPVEGVAYKFYVYNTATGTDCYINGKMKNTFYFMSVPTYEEGLDVFVEYVEGSTEEFNLTVTIDGAKKYINVIKSGTHINGVYEATASSAFVYDTEWNTISTTLDGTKYYLGVDGTFDTVEPQKTVGAGYYMGYLVTQVDKTTVGDMAKITQEKNRLILPAAYVGNYEATVVDHGSTYPEVQITWSSTDANVTVNGNKISFTDPTATKTVTLKATLAIGETTDTIDLTVKLVKNDAESILAAAYALDKGASFGNEATLTGIISAIPTEYDEEYANVTVTMIVGEDLEQPINCYRLVGTNANTYAIGYTITVKGIITNYNGTVQFTKGCEATSYVEGDESDVPQAPTYNTPEEIVNALYALEAGKNLPGTHTLTGVITAVNSAYDSGFKNVTVTIVVGNMTDKPVYCYRIKGDGADVIKVGDTITVTGTLTHYVNGDGTYHSYQFTAGSTLDSYVEGVQPDTHETLTIVEALEEGAKFTTNNSYTTDSYYITGTIVEISNTKYGNAYIADENGNVIYVYGLDGENGELYQDLATKPVVGDTVKVLSVIGYYNGIQLKDAIVCEITKPAPTAAVKALTEKYALTFVNSVNAAGDITVATAGATYSDVAIAWASNSTYAVVGEGKITWTLPTVNTEVVLTATITCGETTLTKEFKVTIEVADILEAGVAYKFYLDQKTAGKIYYFIGAQSGNFLSTSEHAVEGVDVYAEKATGGYHFYFYKGETKTYINYNSSNKPALETTAKTAFSYNAESNYWYANGYYLGTYSTYTTVATSALSYVTGSNAANVDKTQFPARFVKASEVVTDAAIVAYEKDQLKVATTSMSEAGTIDLSAINAKFQQTEITWALKETYAFATLADKVVTVTLPTETSTFVIVATIKVGDVTETKEFEITVAVGEVVVPALSNATLSFADKANRTVFTTTQQVWTQNGITLTNDKASSSNAVADYAAPARFYKGSKITVEGKGMTKVVFTCNGSSYYLKDKPTNGTLSANGKVITITFAEPVDSFTISLASNQVRFDSITVNP